MCELIYKLTHNRLIAIVVYKIMKQKTRNIRFNIKALNGNLKTEDVRLELEAS